MASAPISEQIYKDFSAGVFEQSAQETPHPVKAQFEITYRCNIHCVHCYTDPYNTPAALRKELSLSEIIRLLDEMAGAGILWLTLTGGEAVIHPQFRAIYKEAKARGFILTLLSNATTLTESIVDFLAEDPPFQLDVSVHGASKRIFEQVTQVSGSYDWFLRGIRRALTKGLPIQVKTNALSLNRQELPQIKTLVEGLGLEFNLNTPLYPRLNGDLSPTQYRLPASDIVDLEMGDVLGNSSSLDPCAFKALTPADDRLFRCGCGTSSLTISPYGVLRACTFTTWPEYDLKTLSLKEAFAQLAQAIRNARYEGTSLCRSCPAYTLCDKNPVMAQHESGSMEAPVPHFCDVAFTRKEKLGSIGTRS